VLTKSNAKQKQRGQTKKSSYDKKFMISSFEWKSKLGLRKLLSFLMVCICDGFFPSSMQHVTEEGRSLVKLAEDAASNKKVRFNSVVVVIAGCRLSFLLQ
jgi:hypothetical protein